MINSWFTLFWLDNGNDPAIAWTRAYKAYLTIVELLKLFTSLHLLIKGMVRDHDLRIH